MVCLAKGNGAETDSAGAGTRRWCRAATGAGEVRLLATRAQRRRVWPAARSPTPTARCPPPVARTLSRAPPPRGHSAAGAALDPRGTGLRRARCRATPSSRACLCTICFRTIAFRKAHHLRHRPFSRQGNVPESTPLRRRRSSASSRCDRHRLMAVQTYPFHPQREQPDRKGMTGSRCPPWWARHASTSCIPATR